MEVNTQRRLGGLNEKVPDIEKTLDMVRHLRKREVLQGYPSYSASKISHETLLTLFP